MSDGQRFAQHPVEHTHDRGGVRRGHHRYRPVMLFHRFAIRILSVPSPDPAGWSHPGLRHFCRRVDRFRSSAWVLHYTHVLGTVDNTSRHLQTLKAARLIEAEKDGLYVKYRLADTMVCEFFRSMRVYRKTAWLKWI